MPLSDDFFADVFAVAGDKPVYLTLADGSIVRLVLFEMGDKILYSRIDNSSGRTIASIIEEDEEAVERSTEHNNLEELIDAAR